MKLRSLVYEAHALDVCDGKKGSVKKVPKMFWSQYCERLTLALTKITVLTISD